MFTHCSILMAYQPEAQVMASCDEERPPSVHFQPKEFTREIASKKAHI